LRDSRKWFATILVFLGIDFFFFCFVAKDAAKVAITEEKVKNPSPRVNAALVPNPLKDKELILFGGEFYNGETTYVYNDLFRYHVDKNEWTKVSSPNSPTPRCSHQVITYKCVQVVSFLVHFSIFFFLSILFSHLNHRNWLYTFGGISHDFPSSLCFLN
jgi:hypothetical protein